MISKGCGVHSGVGGRISYQSAEAFTYTKHRVAGGEKCCREPSVVVGPLEDSGSEMLLLLELRKTERRAVPFGTVGLLSGH